MALEPRDNLPEAWHLEVLTLAGLFGKEVSELGITEAEVQRAESFMGWLYRDVDRSGDDPEIADTLRRWCFVLCEQMPRSLWDPSSPAGAALQRIAFRVGGVAVPDADPRLDAEVSQERPPEPRMVRLRQVACEVVALAEDKGSSTVGSPLASIEVQRPRVVLASAVLREETLDLRGAEARLHAPPAGPIELRTDRSTLHLAPLTKPSWARAIGRDRFGLWAEFFYEGRGGPGVAYRLRWIPPGRFMMGSPADEPGRDSDEGPQHAVVIRRGFWLGETPVTQALWEAVTGDNPSRFKSPDRPVEQVSWDASQEVLIAALNREATDDAAGEVFRLPTEAEWEYACRAGTETATYAGPIEIRGGNDAPVLDAIAWYGGNSGDKFDLDEGYDSSGWENKQYPHVRAGTRRVGRKLPNPWGLYDMLGNVLEWCEDGSGRDYSAKGDRGDVVTDPRGPATEGARVIRGGSWSGGARYLRVSYRSAFWPGRRSDDLGLRLARGQGSQYISESES